MAAVVDLPLLPVTPMIGAGQFSMNSSISVQSRAPDCRANWSHGLSGRTAGLTTTRSAL